MKWGVHRKIPPLEIEASVLPKVTTHFGTTVWIFSWDVTVTECYIQPKAEIIEFIDDKK